MGLTPPLAEMSGVVGGLTGDHFYTLNDDVVVGWKKSVSPPLDNNGLPLVDVTIASSLFHNKHL